MKKHTWPLFIKFIVVLLFQEIFFEEAVWAFIEKNLPSACIITGEQSGDELAKWFIEKTNLAKTHQIYSLVNLSKNQSQPTIFLPEYENLKKITILNGVKNLLTQLWDQQPLYKKLLNKIIEINPEKLILIDFPWVNLRLARSIKKLLPNTKVTFIAPPELWFWGCWFIDYILNQYCDECIVLYPQEKKWFESKGINTSWVGYPYIQQFKIFLESKKERQSCLALLPGSRIFEVEKSLPLLLQAVKASTLNSEFETIVVQADSIPRNVIDTIIKQHNLEKKVTIISQENKEALSSCFYALTKPGSITLQLALLGVPHAVVFKTSKLDYLILSWIIRPKALGLPNLLNESAITKEFIQSAATPESLGSHIDEIFKSFKAKTQTYKTLVSNIELFGNTFLNHE